MGNHRLTFDPEQGALRACAHTSDGLVPIPVTRFAQLVNALAERDFAEATRARKELRRLGYSVVPLDTPRKAVPR